MIRTAVSSLCVSALFVSLSSTSLYGQETEVRPAVTVDDYGKWEQLGPATLSRNGQWMTYPIARVSEENELRIRRLSDDSLFVVAYGSDAAFSDDGRWLAYSIEMSQAEQRRLRRREEPIRDKLGLTNLATGDTLVIEDVASFGFSDGGAYLAMRRYPLEDREREGVDLIVREMATGTETNFGNVSEYTWQDEGTWLAMAINAEGSAGNGIQVYNPATGALRTLDSEPTLYTGISWREGSDDLAVFRVMVDSAYEDTTHVVLAWRGISSARPTRHEFLHTEVDGFPADTRVVSYRTLAWSDDGQTVFFGIKDWEPKQEDPEAEADTTAAEMPDSTKAEAPDSARAGRGEEEEEEEEHRAGVARP